ncbi:hypothetical protein SNEBB_003868 [Seison nebaliae]|nr:hypothetical protein SNEBB_003868 [Seison nebaliae]
MAIPECHLIGQLVGASEFPDQKLFCKYNFVIGNGWRVIQGFDSGQTQVDCPSNECVAYWSHPIDLHLSTKGLQGWPKINFQVWHQDDYGRHEIYGYGCLVLPMSPGYHELECPTWRPIGCPSDQITQFVVGGGPQLRNPDIVHTATELYRLKTTESDRVTWNTITNQLNFPSELTLELKKFCQTIYLLYRSDSSKEDVKKLLGKEMEEMELFKKLSISERDDTLCGLSAYQIKFDPYKSELRSLLNVNMTSSFQSIQINEIDDKLLNIVLIVYDESGHIDNFLKFKISKEIFLHMRYHMTKSLHLLRILKKQLASHFLETT